MIIVFFLIGALALLVTVLLFGFVGCNWAFGLEETTAYQGDYPTVIKDTSGLNCREGRFLHRCGQQRGHVGINQEEKPMPFEPDFLDVININTGLLEEGRRLFVPGGAMVGGLSFSQGGLE